MKSVLITGVAGYIGSNLAYNLLNKNFNVIGIDDFSNSDKKSISYLKKFKNFQFYKKDLVSSNFNFLAKRRINFLIHLAAISSVENADLNRLETYKKNILGLEKSIQIAKKTKCQSFIFTSSAAVYGNTSNLPIKETNIKDPCSFYGFSKHVNETQIEFYSKELNINFFILRLFNIYGGKNSLLYNNGVISKWIRNIITNKKIILDNKGKCTRDYVYIDDLFKIMSNLLSRKKKKLSIYNVGTGKPVSLSKLLKIIITQISRIKKEKTYSAIEQRKLNQSQINFSFSSNKKIIKELNIKFTKIESGIKNLLNNIYK